MASAPQSEAHADTPPSSTSTSTSKVHIGTRKSKLALAQTDHVVSRLKDAWPSSQIEIFASNMEEGDVDKVTPLRELTGKNIWTQGFETLLMAGKLHMIVHSLKDVPTNLPEACTLGAILNREDARDVLVVKKGLPYKSIEDLPEGSVVGTSSVRRCAQLARRYPHLKVKDVRGNINTRLSKLDAEDSPFTCLILAAAGLLRLDFDDRITEYLDSKSAGMLHAVGQGALGVEIRMGDEDMSTLLEKIADEKATIQCSAERSLLRMLEGGCSAPLGVETDWADGRLTMRAALISVDGSRVVEAEKEGPCGNGKQAEFFGIAVAEEMVKKGAAEILEEIERNKKVKEPIPANQQ